MNRGWTDLGGRNDERLNDVLCNIDLQLIITVHAYTLFFSRAPSIIQVEETRKIRIYLTFLASQLESYSMFVSRFLSTPVLISHLIDDLHHPRRTNHDCCCDDNTRPSDGYGQWGHCR